MRLTFLGTGTAWSKAPRNYNNNALVQAHAEAPPWLIDCGTTAPQALTDMGLNVGSFEGVLVTHLHGDHVFGLEETGFFNFFVHKRRVKLWLPEKILTSRSGIPGEDIWENCLRGTMGTIYQSEGQSREVGLDDYFDVHLLKEGETYDICGVEVEIFEVPHVPNKHCYGLYLNKSIAYTADCIFHRSMLDEFMRRDCEMIFHDVYFGPEFPGRVHTAYSELATLPAHIRERIMLMHYNDSVTEEQLDEARAAGFRVAVHHQDYEL